MHFECSTFLVIYSFVFTYVAYIGFNTIAVQLLAENKFCKGVLTLYFDDVVKETKGAVLFDENMADSVIAFIRSHMDVDTLLIHCYAGQSRSRAIGAFAKKMMGKSNQTYFSADKLWAGTPNEHVYNMLEDAWFRDMLG